jgi:hypothetical protein
MLASQGRKLLIHRDRCPALTLSSRLVQKIDGLGQKPKDSNGGWCYECWVYPLML